MYRCIALTRIGAVPSRPDHKHRNSEQNIREGSRARTVRRPVSPSRNRSRWIVFNGLVFFQLVDVAGRKCAWPVLRDDEPFVVSGVHTSSHQLPATTYRASGALLL
jgi:hypothetical protein